MKNIYCTAVFLILFNSFAISANTTLMISFDGFRWDYPNRHITPKLDSIISDGVRAISLKPVFPSVTFPNHISIMTGMYSENHGIISNSFYDLNTLEKYMVGSPSVRESKWYKGEFFWETARKNGIIAASYFWPGSEIYDDYRRPDYFEVYEHNRDYKKRIDGVINWLKLPDSLRPEFISMYFDETDSKGHVFGVKSIEIDNSIRIIDSLLIYLDSEINKLKIKDKFNLILVSDHGMANIDKEKIIELSSIINCKDYLISNNGIITLIQPPINKVDSVYNLLKSNSKNFSVYKKDEIPSRYHYSTNPFITDILLVADKGAVISNDYKGEKDHKSVHGYDNDDIEMHGIFIARGPDFKKGIKCGTLQNIDIYPLLCRIFKIKPRNNIDGKIERIEFILNQE